MHIFMMDFLKQYSKALLLVLCLDVQSFSHKLKTVRRRLECCQCVGCVVNKYWKFMHCIVMSYQYGQCWREDLINLK